VDRRDRREVVKHYDFGGRVPLTVSVHDQTPELAKEAAAITKK
jgi:hypothetical protein